jgi:predicted transcriptional regulator
MQGIKTWTDREERDAVKALEHPTRVGAFDQLISERLTSREISRRLHQPENLVGYHCRRLLRDGVIEVVEVEPRRGAKAKILRPTVLGLYARERV